MANPIPIPYSKSVELRVNRTDNRLQAFLSPDVGGGGKNAHVFTYRSKGFSGKPGSSMDLTDSLNQIGKKVTNLVLIGSNFAQGGPFAFSIIPDGDESKKVEVQAKLDPYTSTQWAYALQKEAPDTVIYFEDKKSSIGYTADGTGRVVGGSGQGEKAWSAMGGTYDASSGMLMGILERQGKITGILYKVTDTTVERRAFLRGAGELDLNAPHTYTRSSKPSTPPIVPSGKVVQYAFGASGVSYHIETQGTYVTKGYVTDGASWTIRGGIIRDSTMMVVMQSASKARIQLFKIKQKDIYLKATLQSDGTGAENENTKYSMT